MNKEKHMKKVLAALGALGALAMGFALMLTPSTPWACCVFGNPPVINAVNADPGTLWPPNHKMVEILVEVQGTDIDTWYITGVDVGNVGSGEGDPQNDPDFSFDDQFLELRSERSGKAGARVYTVNVTAANGYGTASSWVQVTVPHDMRP